MRRLDLEVILLLQTVAADTPQVSLRMDVGNAYHARSIGFDGLSTC